MVAKIAIPEGYVKYSEGRYVRVWFERGTVDILVKTETDLAKGILDSEENASYCDFFSLGRQKTTAYKISHNNVGEYLYHVVFGGPLNDWACDRFYHPFRDSMIRTFRPA